MSSKLRVGVVGVGYLGKFHARIYASLPDVELVGVVDADPATAARIAAEYQCAAYARPEELLGKVDAVVTCVGLVHFGPVASMTPEQFRKGLNDKLMGQVNLVLLGLNDLHPGREHPTGQFPARPVEDPSGLF